MKAKRVCGPDSIPQRNPVWENSKQIATKTEASKTALQTKVPAINPGDLRLIFMRHMVEKESQLLQVVLGYPYVCHV